eukprot:827288-Pyramimonas_sp.AAC.1
MAGPAASTPLGSFERRAVVEVPPVLCPRGGDADRLKVWISGFTRRTRASVMIPRAHQGAPP